MMAFRGLCTIAILFLCALCKQQVHSLDIIDLLNFYMNNAAAEKKDSLKDFQTEYYKDEPAQVWYLCNCLKFR